MYLRKLPTEWPTYARLPAMFMPTSSTVALWESYHITKTCWSSTLLVSATPSMHDQMTSYYSDNLIPIAIADIRSGQPTQKVLYSMLDTTTARYICSLLCSVIRGCLKHIAQSEWNAAVPRLQRWSMSVLLHKHDPRDLLLRHCSLQWTALPLLSFWSASAR